MYTRVNGKGIWGSILIPYLFIKHKNSLNNSYIMGWRVTVAFSIVNTPFFTNNQRMYCISSGGFSFDECQYFKYLMYRLMYRLTSSGNTRVRERAPDFHVCAWLLIWKYFLCRPLLEQWYQIDIVMVINAMIHDIPRTFKANFHTR